MVSREVEPTTDPAPEVCPQPASGTPPVMVWSADDCRRALRATVRHRGDRSLRIVDYRAWRNAQARGFPTDGVIVRCLGPWTQAVRRVGGRTVFFTDADCINALSAAADDLGVACLRQDDYQTWAEGGEGRPEKQAIMSHLGPWPVAVTAAGLTPGRVTQDLQGQLT